MGHRRGAGTRGERGGLIDRLFLDFQSAIAGRYSLERELGRGGMGVVYLAREVRLERPVAIKLLPPELAAHASLRERFLREARTAARLSHPHVVPIHAVDEVGGFVFFAMAFIRGQTLAQRLAERGPLPPAEATRVLREVAWALAHAHSQGVVHRDVKPENILLEDGSGRALVADFGIARLAHASGGRGVSEVLGTPDFMSPEQASGDRVDARSDVYSLGVVGYYAVSGRLPFTGPTAVARMTQHITQAPPPLASVAPAVPRPLAGVIGRCLAKAPEARFGDGAELAEVLSATLEQRREPPVALRMFLAESPSVSAYRLFPSFLLGGLGIWLVLELTLSPILAPQPPAVSTILDLVRLGVLGGAVLGPFGIVLQRLRRLIRAGHGYDEFARALADDARRLREDYAAAAGREPGLGQVAVHRVWLAATAVAAGFAATALLGFDWIFPEVSGAVAALTGAASLLGSGAAWRASVFSGFRQRFWESRVGRALFGLAGIGRVRRVVPPDTAGRPTEFAVGAAALALFEVLPGETRAALSELPEVVERLEEHAQRARRRCDELSGALTDAEGFAGTVGPERRAALIGDLRAAHSAAQRRLAQAVAALELIRLDLLRLRTGAATLDHLTADLEAARELGAQAERMAEAREEVAELLRGKSGGALGRQTGGAG